MEAYKIRNGCGWNESRLWKYSVVENYSSVMDVIKKIFERAESTNNLINITPIDVIDVKDTFVERKCRCCGDEDI